MHTGILARVPPMEFFEHERHERWRGTKHLIFQFLRVRIDFKIAFFRSQWFSVFFVLEGL